MELPSPGKNFGNLIYLVALRSKRPNRNFYRRAVKMSKKSWRETFGFTGLKFWCKILSPGEKFGNLTNLVALHDRCQVLVARPSKRPNRNFQPCGAQNGKTSWGETLRTTGVKFRSESECQVDTQQPKCRDDTLQFFTHFGCAMAENYKSVFLTVVRPICAFDQHATKTWVRSFEWVKFSKF